jgi:superfamily I DNA/RNA helicase
VKFGGLEFLDAAHVKDMLALLRFVENPRDHVAGFRVPQLMPGIGPTSSQRVMEHIARKGSAAVHVVFSKLAGSWPSLWENRRLPYGLEMAPD